MCSVFIFIQACSADWGRFSESRRLHQSHESSLHIHTLRVFRKEPHMRTDTTHSPKAQGTCYCERGRHSVCIKPQKTGLGKPIQALPGKWLRQAAGKTLMKNRNIFIPVAWSYILRICVLTYIRNFLQVATALDPRFKWRMDGSVWDPIQRELTKQVKCHSCATVLFSY